MVKWKTSAAIGSATPDPVKSNATTAPVPKPVVANKPAPGQTGPRGMQPRQTYSRVNTGAPPVPDAGTSIQKNSPIRGMEFLPAKVAGAEATMTTMMKRPDLNTMLKEAMAGTLSKADINAEVARMSLGSTEKTASASVTNEDPDHLSSEQVHKLASAVGYIAEQLLKEAETVEPGKGPGAIQVLEATSSEKNIDAGESGQASGGNQPPQTPATQTEEVQTGKANTGLETNDSMMHPEQPVEPISNEKASIGAQKQAEALFLKNAERMRKIAKGDPEGHKVRRLVLGNPLSAAVEAKKGDKGKAFLDASKHNISEILKGTGGGIIGGGVTGGLIGLAKGKKGLKDVGKRALKGLGTGAAGGAAVGSVAGNIRGTIGEEASKIHGKYSKNKESSVPVALIRKLAEDAINPAKVSGGTLDPSKPPDGVSEAEQAKPPVPSDVSKQQNMVSSNQAAIDYTKRDAKADPKADVNKVLDENAQTKATDKVLDKVLDHTDEAGAKISSVRENAIKTAAARALLSKMLKSAEENCKGKEGDKKKEKSSQGMGGGSAPSTPQAASGFNATSI